MSVDVTAAVLEQLRAALPADVTVFDGRIDGPPPQRYVVVWGDTGTVKALAIDAVSRDVSYSVQVTSVVTAPLGAENCRWLSTQVRDALADFRPAADDLVAASLFVHEQHRRPVDDESVPDRHVMFAVDVFSLDAVRT